MNAPLIGKVALVTGGSSGIGLEIARRLVAGGAFVFISRRRQGELQFAAASIGGGAVAIPADSSKLSDLERVFQEIRAKKGQLDIVVANAGIREKAPIGKMTEEHFDRLFDINVKGLVFTVQNAVPHMPDRSSVILLSSTVSGKGMGNNCLCAATKAAIGWLEWVASGLAEGTLQWNAWYRSFVAGSSWPNACAEPNST